MTGLVLEFGHMVMAAMDGALSNARRGSVVSYQVEPWATYVQDAPSLWVIHHKEVAIDQEEVPLDVDFEGYAALDALGKLLIVTARADGVLIGYWKGILLGGHLHYKSTPHAIMDIVYLHPDWRRGWIAWRLHDAVEAAVLAWRKHGLVRLTGSCKIHDGLDLSPFYLRRGYAWTEKQFSKLLRA